MAIVSMLKVTLLALRADRAQLMQALQDMGCVEIIESPAEAEAFAYRGQDMVQEYARHMADIRWALMALARYDNDPKPIFGTYPEIDAHTARDTWARAQDILSVIDTLNQIERTRGELHAEELRLTAAIQALTPWQGWDADEQDMQQLKTVQHVLGAVPARNLPALEDALRQSPAALQVIGHQRDQQLLYVAGHRSAFDQVQAALDQAEFTRETLAEAEGRAPRDTIARHEKRLQDIAQQREQLTEQTAQLAGSIHDLKVLHDLYEMEQKKAGAAALSAETEQVFLLRGWVPKVAGDKLRRVVARAAPSSVVELTEPAPDEQPTVLLRNKPVVAAFEPVVEGFGMPDYRSIDPTALMAPFYAMLFGMMVSDAGYGLLMALAIPIFIKVKKIKFQNARMLWLLIFGGLATVVWGIAFNTFFGFNPVPQITSWFPFDTVNRPLEVMVLCMAVGVLHLFAGLGMAAYMNFKRRDPVAAISDQFSWALLLIGLGLMLLPQTASAGTVLALIGAGIILLMTKRGEKNPIKRILGGLGALYGVSSWVSDILSYMRLFGMGLATGVIGMVFNTLIAMVWDGGILAKALAIVLFVGCHLFNLGINALGAYVHACRLQYIEFFGKFFEEGGKPFKPLNNHTRYVRIVGDASPDNAA